MQTSEIPTVQAVIFDLDGTLADTVGAIRDGINEAMRSLGYPEKSYDEVRHAIGNGAKLLVRRCMPPDAAEDEQRFARAFEAYERAYSVTYLNTRECYAGVVQTVKALYARGIKLAVLSNKQDAFTKGLVGQLFPDGEFSVVWGQSSLPTKPDPTAPLLLCKGLGVAPCACLFIGDSDVDMQTAQNAGMIGVGCAWGYRGRASLEAAGARVVIDRPEQVLELL